MSFRDLAIHFIRHSWLRKRVWVYCTRECNSRSKIRIIKLLRFDLLSFKRIITIIITIGSNFNKRLLVSKFIFNQLLFSSRVNAQLLAKAKEREFRVAGGAM